MNESLSAEQYARVCDLVGRAAELNAADHAAFLKDACGDDRAVLNQAQAMLSRFSMAALSGFLDRTGPLKLSLGDDLPDPLLGQRLGHYLVQQRVASGGMGHVYRAVRLEDYRQTVAIKVLRIDMDGAGFLRRFREERQLQARLQHPNIAALLDGGTTPDGRPYFVMEFVDGRCLTRYAEERRLDVRARLLLFRAAAAAVQFAHSKDAIHRDIKPSNILVAVDGQVKLVDFGIAKVASESIAAAAMPPTAAQERAMTLEYASPEQFRGHVVRAPSDVYSLGIVLYELLSGAHPYPLDGLGFAEIERRICEVSPAPPSALVERRAGASVTRNAADVHSSAVDPKLRKKLRGDLDSIVMMAIRKEPDRRYASVGDFANDIDRYLRGEPVLARRESLTYQARKLVQRNPWPATFSVVLAVGVGSGLLASSATLLVLSMTVGLIGTITGFYRARRASNEVERRFREIRELATTILFEIDAGLAKVHGATMLRRYVMERVLEKLDRIERDAGNCPELLHELATGYYRAACVLGKPDGPSLGQYEQALLAAERSAQLGRRLMSKDRRNAEFLLSAASAELLIAEISAVLASGEDATPRQKAIVEWLESALAQEGDHPRLAALVGSGCMLLGRISTQAKRFDQAAKHIERAACHAQGILNRDPADTDALRLLLAATTATAFLHGLVGRHADGVDASTEAVRISGRITALPDATTTDRCAARRAEFQRARALWACGDVANAQCEMETTVNRGRKLLEDDPADASLRLELGSMLYELGLRLRIQQRLSAARPWLQEAAETLQPLLTAEGRDSMALLALVYRDLGQIASDLGDCIAAEIALSTHLDFASRFVARDPNDLGAQVGLMNAWLKMAINASVAGLPEVELLRRWDQAARTAEPLANINNEECLVSMANLWEERLKAMRRLDRWEDVFASSARLLETSRLLLPRQPMFACRSLHRLVEAMCELATCAGPSSLERLHEARAYCQSAIAVAAQWLAETTPAHPDVARMQSAHAAWRQAACEIDQAICEYPATVITRTV